MTAFLIGLWVMFVGGFGVVMGFILGVPQAMLLHGLKVLVAGFLVAMGGLFWELTKELWGMKRDR